MRTSIQAAILALFGTLIFAAVSASAAQPSNERLIGSNGALQAYVSTTRKLCGSVISVTLRAPDYNPFLGNREPVKQLMLTLSRTLSARCAKLRQFWLKGYVGTRLVYRGVVVDIHRPGTLDDQYVANELSTPAPVGAPSNAAIAKARSVVEQCQMINHWGALLTQEYPELPSRIGREELLQKAANLFRDDYFVPVFGAPYDRMIDNQQEMQWFFNLYNDGYRTCSNKNPILAEVLFDASRRPSAPQLSALMVKRREVRQELNASTNKIESMPVASASLDAVVKATQFAKSQAAVLWPSEQKQIADIFDSKLRAVATSAANERLAELQSAATPVTALKIIHETLAGPKGQFIQYLTPADGSAFREKLSTLQHSYGRKAVASIIGTADRLPRTPANIDTVIRLPDDNAGTRALLSQEDQTALDQSIRKLQTNVFAAIVRSDLQTALALPHSFASVKQTLELEANRAPILKYLPTEQQAQFHAKLKAFRMATLSTVLSDDLSELGRLPPTAESGSKIMAFEMARVDALKDAPADERSAYEMKLQAFRENFLSDIIKTDINRLTQLPSTVGSVGKIDQLETQRSAIIDKLSDAERASVKTSLQDIRDRILTQAVQADLKQLHSYSQGKVGLQQSAKWRQRFQEKYVNYMSSTEVQKGLEAFRTDRIARLMGAVSEFKQALEKMPGLKATPDSANHLMQEYLCWQGDMRMPESLEYLLVMKEEEPRYNPAVIFRALEDAD